MENLAFDESHSTGFSPFVNAADDSTSVSVKSVSSCVNLLIVEPGQPLPNDNAAASFKVIHSKKKQGTSCDETLMHMIKANVGTGVLAIPLAFKMAGMLVGSLGLWFTGFLCVHCIHLLLKSYNHVVKSDSQDSAKVGYEDVVFLMMQERFGVDSRVPLYVRSLISVFLVVSQLGFCSVYFIFISTNIEQVVQHYQPETSLTTQGIMALILVPMVLYCLIRDLKYLAPFSALANFIMIGSIGVILYDLFLDGELKPYKELVLVAPLQNWPIFFSSAVYAFEGISCVLPVYHGMHSKEFFTPINGVLNTAMFVVAALYYAVGFFGYLKYGNDCAASITLNLAVENVLFQAVKLLFAIGVFISYNLQFLVGCDILWSMVHRSSGFLQRLSKSESDAAGAYPTQVKYSGSRLQALLTYSNVETAFRSAIVLLTFLMAFIVPKLDLFISFIGAVGSSTLALIVPPILDLLVFWPLAGYSSKVLAKDLFILAFGIYIFLAGTFLSLNDIFKYLFNS